MQWQSYLILVQDLVLSLALAHEQKLLVVYRSKSDLETKVDLYESQF